MTCESCGEATRFQRWRSKHILTFLGSVRVERAYYHCPHCRHGQFPRDAQLGLSACDLSRGAAEAVALGGTHSPMAAQESKTFCERTSRVWRR